MIIKSTLKKKNSRGRWNFVINAALRAPEGMAVVIEGLPKEDLHTAVEAIKQRTNVDLLACRIKGLLIVYRPSMEFWK